MNKYINKMKNYLLESDLDKVSKFLWYNTLSQISLLIIDYY